MKLVPTYLWRNAYGTINTIDCEIDILHLNSWIIYNLATKDWIVSNPPSEEYLHRFVRRTKK